ncbi:hypothetical protein CLAFUW4_11507 [Fulvia fulva]|nr:hypothetical protein CLAFUR4_11513 [Fulvia fulva]WPV17034.1 hypothetical protein CLAFUW4_11507 [Fulvia fulva]WPV32174.1 hypothetical protein CLAFUW7_11512 [Fulvia fulva]
MQYNGRCLVDGTASGRLLYSDVPLSFGGGVDPVCGEIVDGPHPLRGQRLKDHVLAIPSGRGSCSGSVAILEVLLNGTGPAALIFQHEEQILTLGIIVSKMMFDFSIPVVVVGGQAFEQLKQYDYVAVSGRSVVASHEPVEVPSESPKRSLVARSVTLTMSDQAMLDGKYGEAASIAMKVLYESAEVQQAASFIDVTQAHIDACVYTGPAGIRFAEHFLHLGDAKFAVPTSMNAISIDKRRWQEIGVDAEYAKQAERLADAYTKMGARPTYTGAPYLLDTVPTSGQHIGWAESNAVNFANSVLGACTQKYPDFIDVCIALTGRAPAAGCHVEEQRAPKLVVEVAKLAASDDSLWPLFGYAVGHVCGPNIPVVLGLEGTRPTMSDLKAFGAAFATTSSAPMFHMSGVTPEASKHEASLATLKRVQLSKGDVFQTWQTLNTAQDSSISLIALGNPHFSFEELTTLSTLCSGKKCHTDISFVVTTSRHNYSQASQAGALKKIEDFGAQILCDTCWCMIQEPIATPEGGHIMTNSGKYAHYAPGLVKRKVHFGSLQECVDTAVVGKRKTAVPRWLL